MNTQKLIQQVNFGFERILDLFYPPLCIVCEHRTHSVEELFCLDCQYHIHPSNMHLHRENEFTAHFKGRLDLRMGAALYYYVKGGRLQKAIELLKYKDRPDIGLRLGRFYGTLLIPIIEEYGFDIIIPVPLHRKRKIQRGYNQSYVLGSGMSEILKIPVRDDILIRSIATYSQTEKNRLERSANMQKVFELAKPDLIKGRHILLIDDIMTTGATLEACAKIAQRAGAKAISMATIAIAT